MKNSPCLLKGDTIYTPPLLWHATYHHKVTEMLVISRNFRDRKLMKKTRCV